MACLRKRRKRWSSKDACDEPAFPLLARPRRERCGALTQVKATNRACLRRAATKASRFRCLARPVRRTSLRRVIMADDKGHVGAPDRDRLSLGDEHEIRDWPAALGVSRAHP